MKKIIALVLFTLTSFIFTQSSSANEGIVQMRAQDGTAGICEVYSNLLDNFQYALSVNCRDLKYPIAQNLFQYALWTDNGNGEASFMGTLGIGKRQFTATQPFARLVVTKEAVREPEEPSGNIYMSGGVQQSAFLEGRGIELATAEPAEADPAGVTEQTSQNGVGNFGQESTDETQTAQPSIGNAIRILGGVVVFIVVVVIVIAFISASRRRPVSI